MEVHKTYQDIGDPEDWPAEWIGIRDIDSSLRCSICCEYMVTPMILSKCSHSYCSLCIRRSISYKTQCPTCFMPATDGDMVNNRSLGEIIQKFSVIRKPLLAILCGNNNHMVETAAVPSAGPTCSKPDRGIISSLFGKSKSSPTKSKSPPTKSKSSHTKSPPADSVKVATATKKKSKQYGLRKSHEKKYIQSDDSDTVNSDSDSDVIICCDAELDSSDEDFQPMTPSTNRKKKNTAKTGRSASKKVSSHRTGNLDTSRTSDNKPKEVTTNPLPKSVEPVQVIPIIETADKIDMSGYQSPLRLPSLNPSSSLQSSTPIHSQVPSCSSAAQGSSAEKEGRAVVKVPCPVCGVPVSDKHINLHLDRCLTNKGRTAEPRSTPKRKQMPKLVYNLLSDKDLKKKCAEVGLNNQGDRQTLTKRHHEFTLMYNSQCDATKPMTSGEIIREVEKTERAKTKGLQMKMTSVNKLVIQKGSSADQVEAAQKEYAKQHKSQFAQLVEEARKRRMKKQAEKAAAASASEENTGETETPVTTLPAAETETPVRTLPAAAANSKNPVTDARVAEPTVSTPLKETDHPIPAPPSQPNYPVLNTMVPPTLPSICTVPTESASMPNPGAACDSAAAVGTAASAMAQWNDDLETQFLEDDSSDMLLVQQPEVMPVPVAALSFAAENFSAQNAAAHNVAEQTVGKETVAAQSVAEQTVAVHSVAAQSAVAAAESHTAEDIAVHDAPPADVAEENGGDETLPLDDSQLNESDDDMFDSPGSPSLLVDAHQSYTQNSYLTFDNQGGDHTNGNAVTTHVPSDLDIAQRTLVEAASVPATEGGGELENQGSGEIESEDRDFVETVKNDKRKRGRPKKDSKAKVKPSRTKTEGVDVASTIATVSAAGDVQLGWSDIHGHEDAAHREDAVSETLSEPASGVSSLSHTDGSIGDFNPPSWSRDLDINSDVDLTQPRRSGRARNKRKLSVESSEPAAVGKRSRRPELPKDTDEQSEIPTAEEIENKSHGERRRQGRRK